MRTRRWDPASKDLDGLLFDGAPALLGQLDDLVRRPRRWWRETLLPIIFLVCGPTVRNPLDGLADRLLQARGVLYSRINGRGSPLADNGQLAEKSIRSLLDGVVADLSQRSGRGRPLKFPHYSLAVWLESLIMNHTRPLQPDQSGRRVDNALQEFLKERYRLQNRTTSVEVSLIREIPWWVRIPVLLLPPLGIRLMRMLWHPPQWVARTGIASAHSSGSFRGLARKFMEQGSGERQHNIQRDEIDRLLVDAFMEDLRRDYRRIPLFFFGRRKMTYPVLLIDQVESSTVGLRLLDFISDSRSGYLRKNSAGPGRQPRERAYFHPLLVIAQGGSSAFDAMRFPDDHSEYRDGYSIADIKYYYGQWYRALADSGRTWFIPLRVPGERPPEGLRTRLTEILLPFAPRPVMTFVMVALLIVTVSFTTYSTYYTHCGAWYWEPQLHRQTLTGDRDQCVGLGSDKYRFFDDVGDVDGMDLELARDLREVEAQIHRDNEQAIKSIRYLTVVYLSELSSRDVADYRSELENLRGIVVAQQGSLRYRPVRVLLANGGDGMDYGLEAAEAIAREARKDRTLVAVVGLGVSRTGTRDAIVRLARQDTHIPTIGTAISDTTLATQTGPYYHQVGPTNKREAEIGAFYAVNHFSAREVTIYYPDDREDLYSSDLKNQAKSAFKASGFTVHEERFRPSGDDISRAGGEACGVGSEGLVFYAGRSSYLRTFLTGMRNYCQGNYPHFLAGDAVSRFMLDRGIDGFPGLTIDYLSPASSLAWGSGCKAIDNISFFAEYRRIYGEKVCPGSLRGGSLLTHDTLLAFVQGAQNTRFDRPSPDALLAGIEDISSEGLGLIHGASGQIDYPRTGEQAVPKNKAILVLRSQAGQPTKRMLLCGQLDKAQPLPDDRCPA